MSIDANFGNVVQQDKGELIVMNSKLSPAMEEAIRAMNGCTAERIDTSWWSWWKVIGPNRFYISTRTMKALERRGLIKMCGKRATIKQPLRKGEIRWQIITA